MMPKTKPGETPEMAQMISKQMLFLMPIFTIFIAGRFPAALPIYWIITTLFAIGQQWWVSREPEVKSLKSNVKSLEGKTIGKRGVEITVRKKK